MIEHLHRDELQHIARACDRTVSINVPTLMGRMFTRMIKFASVYSSQINQTSYHLNTIIYVMVFFGKDHM